MDENFEALRKFFKTDVANHFICVLQEKYQNVKRFIESKTYDKLEDRSKQQIKQENSFLLNVPVLFDILLKGKCESENGSKMSYDDISTLKEIWKTHISENYVEKINQECMTEIKTKLREIGDRMDVRLDEIGKSDIRIQQTNDNQSTTIRIDAQQNEETSIQIGDNNMMHILVDVETKNPIYLIQIGPNNNVTVCVEDRRQTKDGQTKDTCRLVLRSKETDAWKRFMDGVLEIDIEAINRQLQPDGLQITSTEKGCLVLSFNTPDDIPMEKSLTLLFEGLNGFLNIEDMLHKSNVTEMQVDGYVYCPEQFPEEAESETYRDLLIIRHLSWTKAATVCDIDVYASKFMKRLIQEEFTTNVDECIQLQIKTTAGAAPTEKHFTEKTRQLLTKELKPFFLELQNLDQEGNIVYLSLKCTGEIAYTDIIKKDGPIVVITKICFTESESLMRLSVFLGVNFNINLETKQGLVLYLKSLSKSLDTVNLLQTINTMLEKKDVLMFKEDLKIKAVLEDWKDHEANNPETKLKTRLTRCHDFLLEELEPGYFLKDEEMARLFAPVIKIIQEEKKRAEKIDLLLQHLRKQSPENIKLVLDKLRDENSYIYEQLFPESKKNDGVDVDGQINDKKARDEDNELFTASNNMLEKEGEKVHLETDSTQPERRMKSSDSSDINMTKIQNGSAQNNLGCCRCKKTDLLVYCADCCINLRKNHLYNLIIHQMVPVKKRWSLKFCKESEAYILCHECQKSASTLHCEFCHISFCKECANNHLFDPNRKLKTRAIERRWSVDLNVHDLFSVVSQGL